MGMSDKKTTTDQSQKQSSQFSQTATPNVPSWISDPAQAMAGQIGALQAQGPGAFTPTTSALEDQVTKAGQTFTPAGDYTGASAAYGGVPNVEGQSLLTNLSDYYNPFKEQVLNPVMQDFDFQAGQQRAAQAAQAAGPGRAFQGSRYGIQEGETLGAQDRARAATEGGLLGTMFNTATGLSATDAAARQQAMMANQQAALAKAQGLTGLDTAKNAEQLAGLQLQAGLGQRATEEQQLQQQYPLTYAAQMGGLLQGLNPALFTGQSTSGTGSGESSSKSTQTVSDPMGTIANLMSAASGLIPGVGQIGGLFKGVTAAGGMANLGKIGAQGAQMFG